jgi:hypothetical protein
MWGVLLMSWSSQWLSTPQGCLQATQRLSLSQQPF